MKKWLSVLAISCASLCVSSAAFAAPHGYIEGGLGLTGYNIDDIETDPSLGFSFMGGIAFNDYFGVELGWLNLGESDLSEVGGEDLEAWGVEDASFSTSGLTLGARCSFPINEQFSLYARPGFYRWKAKSESTDTDGWKYSDTSDTETDLYVGFGGKFAVQNNFYLGGEATFIGLNMDEQDGSALRFGVNAGFTFGK